MNQTTVTMPMSEYEFNKEVIKQLQDESIENFLDKDYSSLETGKYTVSLDVAKVNEYLDKKYPERQKAVFRTVGPSEYIMTKQQPPIRMSCMNCEHQERSHFGRIRSCPECDGVLVDVYEKDIMDKVLKNAGYVLVNDMNVNDVLSMTMKEIGKAMNKESLLRNATVR